MNSYDRGTPPLPPSYPLAYVINDRCFPAGRWLTVNSAARGVAGNWQGVALNWSLPPLLGRAFSGFWRVASSCAIRAAPGGPSFRRFAARTAPTCLTTAPTCLTRQVCRADLRLCHRYQLGSSPSANGGGCGARICQISDDQDAANAVLLRSRCGECRRVGETGSRMCFNSERRGLILDNECDTSIALAAIRRGLRA